LILICQAVFEFVAMFSLLFQFCAIYYPLTLILPTLFMAVLSDTRLINLRNSHAYSPAAVVFCRTEACSLPSCDVICRASYC